MIHALLRDRPPRPSIAMNSTAVNFTFGMIVMQQMIRDWLPRRVVVADGNFSMARAKDPLPFCYIEWPATIDWSSDAESIN